MVYGEGNMDPQAERLLRAERRKARLDLSNPEATGIYQENLALAKRIKGLSDEEAAIELILISHRRIISKDRLTGLSSYRGLQVELQAAAVVARTFKIPLSILFIDADRFKLVNDTFGHITGDNVLKAIAEGIRKGAKRMSDIEGRLAEEEQEEENQTVRYGGDEFVAILLEADTNGAMVVAGNIATEITQEVDKILPEYRDTFGKPFTVTIGMAQYDPDIDADAWETLIRADKDLLTQRKQRDETSGG